MRLATRARGSEESPIHQEGQVNNTMPKYEVRGDGVVRPLEDKPRAQCRKWQVRVAVGRGADGKYRTRCKTVRGTYTQAVAAKRDFIAELTGGLARGKSAMTVGECCDAFFVDYSEGKTASGKVTGYTVLNTKTALNRVKEFLGDVRMSSVTVEHVDDMVRSLIARGMTPASVRRVRAKAILMARHAEEKGAALAKPWEDSDAPSGKPAERRCASTRQASELAERLLDHDGASDGKRTAVLLCLCCGLRRGEACALEWRDVDFDNGVIHIKHGVNPDGSTKTTKTRAGVRDVPMTDIVSMALLERCEAQSEQFQQLREQNKTTRVCTVGTRDLHPNVLTRWWKDHRGDYGTDLTLHELRHTYLTLLARAGVHPRVMQSLAGHSTSRLVMEVYTHVTIEDKERAVAALSKIMDVENA